MLLVSAAALVDVDGRVLISKRSSKKILGGLWEFPGGKLELNEKPEEALMRELHEELGINTSKSCLAPLSFSYFDYKEFDLLLLLFVCRKWEGIIQPREGQELRWVFPKEIQNFPIMQTLDFNEITSGLCVIPDSTKQLLNINTLISEDVLLVASFFNETNLEFTESQIFNLPKNGYDDISVFARNFLQSANYPPQVLSINSQTFSLEGIIINENFSASIKSLVILDPSNTVKIASRTFNF